MKKKEPTLYNLQVLLLNEHIYTFVLKHNNIEKMSGHDASSRLNIEANTNVHDVIPDNFFKNLKSSHICHNYELLA